MASPNAPLFAAVARFRAAWPRRGWSFDSRVRCVASTFTSDFAAQAQALVHTLMPQVWSDRTLTKADPLIVSIASSTGGLRSGQLIFGGEQVGHLRPYGLWWPWEEGQTISLRVGLAGASQSDLNEFCDVFGVEQ